MAAPGALPTQNLREAESAGPDTFFKGVAIVLAVLTLLTLSPLAVPVILASWLSAIAAPLFARVATGLGGRYRAAAVVVTVLMLLLIGLASLLVAAALSGATELWDLVSTSPGPRSALRALVSPASAAEGLPSPELFTAWLVEHGAQAFGLIGGIAGAAAKLVIGLSIFIFGTWTFLLHGQAAWDWALRNVPIAPARLKRLANAFLETGRGLIIGVGLTCAAQAAAATIIYLALGIPRAVALGVVTGLSSIVPVVGCALIWLPLALGLLLTAHPVQGVLLLVLGVGVISTLDNVLRPVFARFGKLDLPIFLLSISMLGGLVVWGPAGALLGPIFTRLLMEALAIAREREKTP